MTKHQKRTLIFPAVAICAFLLVLTGAVFAQGTEPIVGTWNLRAKNPDQTIAFIAVQTFNAGGTTVEFDSSGTNSSASPGQSITLGKWRKLADMVYRYKEENYIYNAAGSLDLVAILSCDVTLNSTLTQFTGTCATNFYHCSVSSCPDTLFVGPLSNTVVGKRF